MSNTWKVTGQLAFLLIAGILKVKGHQMSWASSWSVHESISPSLVLIGSKVAEIRANFLFGGFAPQRSKVTKLLGRPPDGITSPYAKFGFDRRKGCWDLSSLPVWRLRHEFRLAATGKRFCQLLQKSTHSQGMVWRWSVPILVRIRWNLWPPKTY